MTDAEVIAACKEMLKTCDEILAGLKPETIPPWDVIREQRRAVRAEAGRFKRAGLSLNPEETQILYADDDLEHLRPRRNHVQAEPARLSDGTGETGPEHPAIDGQQSGETGSLAETDAADKAGDGRGGTCRQ